jgi:hypothetical protein
MDGWILCVVFSSSLVYFSFIILVSSHHLLLTGHLPRSDNGMDIEERKLVR